MPAVTNPSLINTARDFELLAVDLDVADACDTFCHDEYS